MSDAKEIASEIAHGLRESGALPAGSLSLYENSLWWIPENDPPSQDFGVTIEITVENGPYFNGIKYLVWTGNAIRRTKKIKSTKKSDNRVKVIETFLSYVEVLQERHDYLKRQQDAMQAMHDKIQKEIGPYSYNITFMPYDENECFVTVYHQRVSFEQAKKIVDMIKENGD